jgi:hypothetical protein
VVRFNATALWHIDAVEWAPSTASKADITPSNRHVRFTPESGHSRSVEDFKSRGEWDARQRGGYKDFLYSSGCLSEVRLLFRNLHQHPVSKDSKTSDDIFPSLLVAMDGKLSRL